MEKLRDKRLMACPRCGGHGWIEVATGDRERRRTAVCPACGGDRLMERVVLVEWKRIGDGSTGKETGASLDEEEFWG